MGVREKDTQGERDRLPKRPMKIISCSLSNNLAALHDLSKFLTVNSSLSASVPGAFFTW